MFQNRHTLSAVLWCSLIVLVMITAACGSNEDDTTNAPTSTAPSSPSTTEPANETVADETTTSTTTTILSDVTTTVGLIDEMPPTTVAEIVTTTTEKAELLPLDKEDTLPHTESLKQAITSYVFQETPDRDMFDAEMDEARDAALAKMHGQESYNAEIIKSNIADCAYNNIVASVKPETYEHLAQVFRSASDTDAAMLPNSADLGISTEEQDLVTSIVLDCWFVDIQSFSNEFLLSVSGTDKTGLTEDQRLELSMLECVLATDNLFEDALVMNVQSKWFGKDFDEDQFLVSVLKQCPEFGVNVMKQSLLEDGNAADVLSEEQLDCVARGLADIIIENDINEIVDFDEEASNNLEVVLQAIELYNICNVTLDQIMELE